MVPAIAERQATTILEAELTFPFSVGVAYDSPSPADPTATHTAGPPSETAFVNQDTATITLSITSITGPHKPTNASASFTGVLAWFHLGDIPTEQPSNVSISVSQDGQELTLEINSNPAPATHPHIVGFKAQLSCTATDGNGTVNIDTPDPTIVYVQPPG